MSASSKKRFIIAGLGNRGRDTFARALLAFPNHGLPEFKQRAEIVAFVDINPERARVANEVLKTAIPIFTSIPKALKHHAADWAIVTTCDYTHAAVATDALSHNLHAFIDKPLATSVWECDKIIAAARKYKRQVIVGHNLRYNEHMLTLAKLVRGGAIGKVQQIEAGEVLDLDHGGSYFHRWHSEFDKSAGLMSHKCCHQLDLINWVIDDHPVAVAGLGDRTYYVPRPDLNAGPRCRECKIAKQCPHFCDLDANERRYRRMYAEVEHVDGYIRDQCVFSDRNTINDREVLNIRYAGGATASFSLITYAPREYQYYYFTGPEGRLEYSVVFDPQAKLRSAAGGAEMGHFLNEGQPQIRLLHKNGAVEFIEAQKLHGDFGHGGADVKMVASVLSLDLPGTDPIQPATPEQARNAVAVADMAARSIADNGRCVALAETGRDFPPFPPSAKRHGKVKHPAASRGASLRNPAKPGTPFLPVASHRASWRRRVK